MKIVKNCSFGKTIIELVNNLLKMSNINILSYFLLFLYMILSGFLEYLALKINLNYLMKVYKLSIILKYLSTLFIAHIRKINLYVINLQYFCLAYIVFKEEN